jgi:hypothetical protein
MLKQARAQQTIHQPADVVWARIGDFGDVSWVPNTDTCVVEGDVRTITMKGMAGFALQQRLVTHDDEQRTLSYELATQFDLSAVFGPGSMVTTINGSLHVEPMGDDVSRVLYDVETDEFMIDGTQAEYQGSLDNLKLLLEQ